MSFLAENPNFLDSMAVIISIAAAGIAYGSYQIAKKTLALSEIEASKKEPKLALYLSDSFCKRIAGHRYFVFSFTVSNSSDSENTITICELRITYKRSDQSEGHISLKHDAVLINDLNLSNISPIPTPCYINSHGAVVGITIFKLDRELNEDLVIDRYEVIFRDSHGIESSKNIFLVKDLLDE